jgi:hypothetical protein
MKISPTPMVWTSGQGKSAIDAKTGTQPTDIRVNWKGVGKHAFILFDLQRNVRCQCASNTHILCPD